MSCSPSSSADLARAAAGDVEAEGRRPALGRADPVELARRPAGRSGSARASCGLVLLDQRRTPCRASPPPEVAQVVDRGGGRRRSPRATACRPRSGGPGGVSSAGRTRSAGSDSARSGRIAAIPRCGPKNLYGEQSSTSRPSSPRAQAPVRRHVHRVRPRQRADRVRRGGDPLGVGDRAHRVGGEREGHHPGALPDAAPRAPRRRASHPPSRSGAVRTTKPWSSATTSHGDTFASWSSAVTTISSPGFIVRATACASWKLSVVMFGAEGDSLGLGAGEVGGGRSPPLHHLVRLARGAERAAQVRVRVAQVAPPSRRSPAAAPASHPGRRSRRLGGERGKLRSQGVDVEHTATLPAGRGTTARARRLPGTSSATSAPAASTAEPTHTAGRARPRSPAASRSRRGS